MMADAGTGSEVCPADVVYTGWGGIDLCVAAREMLCMGSPQPKPAHNSLCSPEVGAFTNSTRFIIVERRANKAAVTC